MLLGIDALEVFVGDDDLAAEAGVGADVFELGRFFGAGVEEGLEIGLVARVEIGIVGPDGGGFDDEGFAVRVEFVGHRGFSVGGVLRSVSC